MEVGFALSICSLVASIAPAPRTLDARERHVDELPLRLNATIVNATGIGKLREDKVMELENSDRTLARRTADV